MKKILLNLALGAALALPLAATAQTSAVTNAILNQRQGLYDKAREDIDKAALNEKTSVKAKTWYTRGEIYEQMMDSPFSARSYSRGRAPKKLMNPTPKPLNWTAKPANTGPRR